ncbi:MAG: hypothetical protein KDC27_16010 [Acidobacteria bacterium]|nr:hypothetical protein [Acidobacteriota bacterium]
MANNYKILRKARMADDLFVADPDNAAWAHEEAEREWARELDLAVESSATALPASILPEIEACEVEEVEAEVTALVRIPARAQSGPRDWADILAESTGDRSLARVRTLGVCGVSRNASPQATAALAQWVARHSHAAALLVEAHLGEPRMAQLFQVTTAGLSEAAASTGPADSLAQATATPNLQVLTGGAKPNAADRRRLAGELPSLVESLRPQFPSLVLELPAALDAAFEQVQPAGLVDAILLVFDPATTSQDELTRAAEKVRMAGVQLAGTVLDTKDVREPHEAASPRAGMFF